MSDNRKKAIIFTLLIVGAVALVYALAVLVCANFSGSQDNPAFQFFSLLGGALLIIGISMGVSNLADRLEERTPWVPFKTETYRWQKGFDETLVFERKINWRGEVKLRTRELKGTWHLGDLR